MPNDIHSSKGAGVEYIILAIFGFRYSATLCFVCPREIAHSSGDRRREGFAKKNPGVWCLFGLSTCIAENSHHHFIFLVLSLFPLAQNTHLCCCCQTVRPIHLLELSTTHNTFNQLDYSVVVSLLHLFGKAWSYLGEGVRALKFEFCVGRCLRCLESLHCCYYWEGVCFILPVLFSIGSPGTAHLPSDWLETCSGIYCFDISWIKGGVNTRLPLPRQNGASLDRAESHRKRGSRKKQP